MSHTDCVRRLHSSRLAGATSTATNRSARGAKVTALAPPPAPHSRTVPHRRGAIDGADQLVEESDVVAPDTVELIWNSLSPVRVAVPCRSGRSRPVVSCSGGHLLLGLAWTESVENVVESCAHAPADSLQSIGHGWNRVGCVNRDCIMVPVVDAEER